MLNLRDTPSALAHFDSGKNAALFAKYGILSEREFKARVQVLIATYNHRVNVEWLTLRNLAIDSVLPAAIGYQQRVAASIAAVQQVSKSIDLAPQLKLLEEITGLRNKLKLAADRLTEVGTKAESNHGREGAAFYRDEVVPAMAELRRQADRLELMVADDLWTLPKYRELLFMQ